MTLEPADLRALLDDKRTHTALGVVFVPPDSPNGKHWEVVTDAASGSAHVMVHVEMMPDREPLFARLGAGAGSQAGSGVWSIPRPGTEVGLIIPHGHIEAGAFIAFVLGSGKAPSGLAENTVVIVAPQGGKVLVHDGVSGTEDALVKRSEFNAHTHTSPKLAVASIPVVHDETNGATHTVDAPSPVTGTTVLKSK